MPVLVRFNNDILFGTRLECQPDWEGDVAPVEILLLLERQLDFSAFFEQLGRKHRFER